MRNPTVPNTAASSTLIAAVFLLGAVHADSHGLSLVSELVPGTSCSHQSFAQAVAWQKQQSKRAIAIWDSCQRATGPTGVVRYLGRSDCNRAFPVSLFVTIGVPGGGKGRPGHARPASEPPTPSTLGSRSGPPGGGEGPSWVEAMRTVHAKFRGHPGTFAHFGDSITDSRAFWSGLPYARRNASPEMQAAFELVNSYMKKQCWDQKGPRFGNQSGRTIRWAERHIDRWLKELNPEVALIMFGTNDLGRVPLEEYTLKTRTVVKKCLDNGTVVILSTIPPRHGHVAQSARFAQAVRKIAEELHVPLIDYHAEILRRRPDDWDGAADTFRQSKGYDVPTLIARDGVHPSNPKRYRNDYSAEGLRNNGYALRNYLALMMYAEVITRVLKHRD